MWKCDEYDVSISRSAGAASGATTNASTPSRIIAHTDGFELESGVHKTKAVLVRVRVEAGFGAVSFKRDFFGTLRPFRYPFPSILIQDLGAGAQPGE
ncbi:hypothetical protein BIW11_02889 [Tropilaelaps mercedesae]|uniref:Uncharacterized protein n=1 Tax=Tropilaelaps mercedesae TaxID=418985 RepID=A0A1V9XVQ4_9ACAR|nr:hypothetical protein BIW11_02889 [Tropilaelaps mercedesae]